MSVCELNELRDEEGTDCHKFVSGASLAGRMNAENGVARTIKVWASAHIKLPLDLSPNRVIFLAILWERLYLAEEIEQSGQGMVSAPGRVLKIGPGKDRGSRYNRQSFKTGECTGKPERGRGGAKKKIDRMSAFCSFG